jgi:hypothetical protein
MNFVIYSCGYLLNLCAFSNKLRTVVTRVRWENDIKMDIQEAGWEEIECLDLAQNRDMYRALVNAVMNPQVS